MIYTAFRSGAGGDDEQLVAFRGDTPLVGLVARLDPQKDPLTAVRAAAKLGATPAPATRASRWSATGR